ncbi:universal stress protein A-like protein [Mangifera indica]|uniref:universal stress protein A-like protein n=1 Tax=Mangifera indica TaxID=29780 RepID=UPI001CFB582A|nr:universal stress protein A-like protein [Mangifera indica]
MERVEPTRIMFAVSESKRYGYPHPSGISRRAFQWTLEKIVLNNTNAFRFSFIHVHSPGATNAQSERNNINGNALLQYFANRCNERQINDYEVINVVGLHVGKIICKEAKRRMPILLIVGRIVQRQRPRTGLNRLTRIITGEVSKHCVKHAKCPVLTYKFSEEDNNLEELSYDLLVDT